MSNRLSVLFAGLNLKNPLIAASAGTTKDCIHCQRAEEAGYSAVILKSIQEESVNQYNPFPRFAVVKNGIAGYNSTTFMSYEQAFEGDIDKYCEEIRKSKEMLSIPVIASLNCANKDTWAQYAIQTEQAGADAIEIVPSCPVGRFVREAADFTPVALHALQSVKKAVQVPVGVKLTQQMSNPILCSIELQNAGADWLTMFNRTPGLQIDIETMAPIMHKGICGHGGPWAIQSVMRWIAESYPSLRVPISATSGVTRYEDVIRYMLAGANNVQIASLIYMKGYDTARSMLTQLEEYLDRHSVASLTDIIGKAANELRPLADADRSSRYYAGIDDQLCIKCGKCKSVCIYDAIKYTQDRPNIDPDRCDGCGLCEQVCNRAISMHKKK